MIHSRRAQLSELMLKMVATEMIATTSSLKREFTSVDELANKREFRQTNIG